MSSLKAYAESHGHHVDLFDFNKVPEVFAVQRAYFAECKAQFPYFKDWNIERNGTEMLAIHQLLYLYSRNRPDYRELVAEVLNMDGRDYGQFLSALDVSRLDALFASLYAKVSSILARQLRGTLYDVVGCSLFNSTWPATLFILKRVKSMSPGVRTVVGGPGPLMGITSRADEVAQFMNHHEFIDYFVVGEGEPPFLRILDEPELPRGILDPGRGLTLLDARNSFVKAEDLPAPDYGQLEISRYLQLSVASSRGCPFECSFCAETVFWKGFRSMGQSRTYQQMDALARSINARRSPFAIGSAIRQSTASPAISGETTARIRSIAT